MPYLAEHHVEVPNKDILSWYFDNPQYDLNQPIYIDAENPDRHYTGHQCRKAIRQLAAGFKSLGLKHGDCVCVFSFNSLHYPVLVNGIVGFGGVYTGCNPSYTSFEMEHHLKSSNAQVVIVEPELLETCMKAVDKVGLPRERVFIFADQEKQGLKSWKVLLERGEMDWLKFDDKNTSQNTIAALLYSSGTTGLPKAAMLSHYNFIAQQIILNHWTGASWDHRRLVALPMFHAATAPVCHFAPLYYGDKMYIHRRFDIEKFLRDIERYQITDGAFVPPIVHAVINSPLVKKYSMKSIKGAHVGAAPLDAGSQAKLRALLNEDAHFTQVWGMTETSCVCSAFRYSEELDTTGAVGHILPNMDVKLCDDDGKDVTAFDTRGEICVRGPLVVNGYYLNPEANRRDWDDEGFFHTGDIGYRDGKSKKWYIVDRKKELIKVRGFQVSPSEIEGVLLTHADIIDVAVIGVPAPNARDGEEPRAYLTLVQGSKLSAEDVHKYLAERLAKYKQLTGGIVIGKEIPKSMSGKKLKRLLVEQAKQEMASEGRRAKM